MALFGKTKTTVLDVEGMTCGHCVMRVQKALTGVKGVKDAKVDLQAKKATVTHDEKVDPTTLVAAVDDTGFKAKVSGK